MINIVSYEEVVKTLSLNALKVKLRSLHCETVGGCATFEWLDRPVKLVWKINILSYCGNLNAVLDVSVIRHCHCGCFWTWSDTPNVWLRVHTDMRWQTTRSTTHTRTLLILLYCICSKTVCSYCTVAVIKITNSVSITQYAAFNQ